MIMKDSSVFTGSSELVKIEKIDVSTSKHSTTLTVNGELEVLFKKSSNEHRLMQYGMETDAVFQRFIGGLVHAVDGQVLEVRDSTYRGFVQSQEGIENMGKKLGFTRVGKDVFARSISDAYDINPLSTSGGAFEIRQGFEWSAFDANLESHFEMWRLVCSNGMVSRSTALSHNIPIVSNWEDNTRIANEAMRHVFDTFISSRLREMPEERASLRDVRSLTQAISRYSETPLQDGHNTRLRLSGLQKTLSMFTEIPGAADLAPTDAARILLPISTYDLMNVMTEVDTHFLETRDPALEKMSSSLLFDSVRRAAVGAGESLKVDGSVFENPDRAFFAEAVL